MQRRVFLKRTALAATGGAVIAAPVHAQNAPVVSWRLASGFSSASPTLFAGAQDVARHLSEVTNGKFRIEILPVGNPVQAGQVLEAVRHRAVDCGHAASTQFFDTDPALCFDAGVPFGLNTRQMNAWMIQGEGLALTRALFGKYNILNFPCGITGAQMGGWFRGEVKTAENLRGLKIQAGGLTRQVLARLGAVPVDLPLTDTYAALEQGGIDAVAGLGPLDDERLAFYQVARNYYFPGWWAGTLQLSLYVNQAAYDALPKSYQVALELASSMATANMIANYDAGNPDALRRLVQRGAQLKVFPRPMLQAAYEAALKLYQELSAKDFLFKQLYESMTAFRDKEIPWFHMAEGSFDALMATQAQPGA